MLLSHWLGGRIDHAHHDGNAAIALTETIAFEEGLIKALELTSDEDTLYIVTADHSHVMSMGGYPSRGNPILGNLGRLFAAHYHLKGTGHLLKITQNNC